MMKVISPNFRAGRDLNEHGVASKERNVQVVALAARGRGGEEYTSLPLRHGCDHRRGAKSSQKCWL